MRLLVAGVLFAVASSLSFAQGAAKREPTDKQRAQQARMSECNAKAASRKGEERKAFMSSCLKGEAVGISKQQAQRDKMASCNKTASAKAMKGDQRKKFMSECLKG